MTRRLLALAAIPALVFSACGEDATFSTSGGSFGPGPATKLARISTAAEYQLRPKRLGAEVGFSLTVDMTGVKGKRFADLEFEIPCVELKATPGGAGATREQLRQGFDRVLRDDDYVIIDMVGRAKVTPPQEAADCMGADTSYTAEEATVVLRDGDDLERHPVRLERPVVLFTPPA